MDKRQEKLNKLKAEAQGRGLSNEDRDDFLRHRFYIDNPDPYFDPEHNKAVIDETIKDYDAYRAKRHSIWVEMLQNRVAMAQQYFKNLSRGKTTPADKYFNDEMMAQLKAEEIREWKKAGSIFNAAQDKKARKRLSLESR